MGDIFVYVEPIDDYIVTVASSSTEIAIEVVEEHEVRVEAFEYPAEITVLSAKISEVEEVANEASSAATTALAAATTAQSSADAAMSQAEAATDIAATNTLSISSILANFTAWVLGTYLGALTVLDAAIATGDSLQAMAGKLQGQLNAVKVRLGVLEDKIILDMTIPTSASSVVITLDKYGRSLYFNDMYEFEIDIAGGVTSGNPYLYLIVNDTTNVYMNASGANFAFYGTAGVIFRQIFELFVTTKAIFCKLNSIRSTADYATVGISALPNSTRDNAIQLPITRLELRTSTATLNAGTRIIIRRK